MKKLKEFLWFLIPFLILSVASVIYFVVNTTYGSTYLKLMLRDPFFIIALVKTFIPSLILSFAVVLIYKITLRFLLKKTVINRKNNYIIIFLISLIAPVFYILIMTRTFDFVGNTIFTLQVGIIVTFVFWLIGLIKEKINKQKERQE